MKLPSLYGSVVVLDEPQALPLEWWPLVDRLVELLTEEYGASVIAMTATQPELLSAGDREPFSLVADPDPYYDELDRLDFVLHPSAIAMLPGQDSEESDTIDDDAESAALSYDRAGDPSRPGPTTAIRCWRSATRSTARVSSPSQLPTEQYQWTSMRCTTNCSTTRMNRPNRYRPSERVPTRPVDDARGNLCWSTSRHATGRVTDATSSTWRPTSPKRVNQCCSSPPSWSRPAST